MYNDRWKELTEGHELEIKWTKSDVFESFHEGNRPKQLKEEKFAVELGSPLSDDVDFRDENDEMLADMDDDFGDLISDLKAPL